MITEFCIIILVMTGLGGLFVLMAAVVSADAKAEEREHRTRKSGSGPSDSYYDYAERNHFTHPCDDCDDY